VIGQDIALPAEGSVLACEENGCAGSTCKAEFALGDGYSNCQIYQTADAFAKYDFAAEKTAMMFGGTATRWTKAAV
jgi:hypothetical protein